MKTLLLITAVACGFTALAQDPFTNRFPVSLEDTNSNGGLISASLIDHGTNTANVGFGTVTTGEIWSDGITASGAIQTTDAISATDTITTGTGFRGDGLNVSNTIAKILGTTNAPLVATDSAGRPYPATNATILSLTVTNFIVGSNSWVNVPSLNKGDVFWCSSNGVPHVIWSDQAGSLYTNRLVP